jgi:hypothetical protein
MKALICPNEPVPNGYRIAQVEPDDKIFGVAEPMYWMNCADEVVADFWYFDPSDRTIKEVPRPVFAPANNQPISSGSQNL